MRKLINLLALALTPITTVIADAPGTPFAIPRVSNPPMLDGRCRDDEWDQANAIRLPADVTLGVMYYRESLYVCASGKAQDYTALDLYIQHEETGQLHNLHISAQLGERTSSYGEWSELVFWELRDWTAFWVPYAGTEESDTGSRPDFLEGSDREVRVLRSKFPGTNWRMMIVVSAVIRGETPWTELYYPEGADDADPSTWKTFAFEDR